MRYEIQWRFRRETILERQKRWRGCDCPIFRSRAKANAEVEKLRRLFPHVDYRVRDRAAAQIREMHHGAS